MKEDIKVSILCQTYNHEKFIRQALESFVMQKTNFAFEVLIHDDASTDKTPKIIKEYENKYPEIIKPIYRKTNLFTKGLRGFVIKFLIPRAQGEYLAICDGDDFFTDENKLQLMADFLDEHSDCSVCFHSVDVVYEDDEASNFIFPTSSCIKEITTEGLLRRNFIAACSVMFRRQNYENLPQVNMFPNDWYLNVFHAKFGTIGFIDKIMATYRKHSDGAMWGTLEEVFEKHGLHFLTMYIEMLKLFPNNEQCKDIVLTHIIGALSKLFEIDKKNKSNLLVMALVTFPFCIPDWILKSIEENNRKDHELANIRQVVQQKNQELANLHQDFQQKDQELTNLHQDFQQKSHELDVIKSTKFWKWRNLCIKMKNTLLRKK